MKWMICWKFHEWITFRLYHGNCSLILTSVHSETRTTLEEKIESVNLTEERQLQVANKVSAENAVAVARMLRINKEKPGALYLKDREILWRQVSPYWGLHENGNSSEMSERHHWRSSLLKSAAYRNASQGQSERYPEADSQQAMGARLTQELIS